MARQREKWARGNTGQARTPPDHGIPLSAVLRSRLASIISLSSVSASVARNGAALLADAPSAGPRSWSTVWPRLAGPRP